MRAKFRKCNSQQGSFIVFIMERNLHNEPKTSKAEHIQASNPRTKN